MANTASLGNIWKPTAWRSGEPVPQLTLPDGTLAEAMASIGYGWDQTNSLFRKILVDANGNLTLSVAADTVGLAKDSTITGSVGTASSPPAAYTALDQLDRIRKTLLQQLSATQQLVCLATPAKKPKTQPTLLHRS